MIYIALGTANNTVGAAGRQEYKGHVGHPIALYYRDIDNGKQTRPVINEINWFFVVHGDARFA